MKKVKRAVSAAADRAGDVMETGMDKVKSGVDGLRDRIPML